MPPLPETRPHLVLELHKDGEVKQLGQNLGGQRGRAEGCLDGLNNRGVTVSSFPVFHEELIPHSKESSVEQVLPQWTASVQ